MSAHAVRAAQIVVLGAGLAGMGGIAFSLLSAWRAGVSTQGWLLGKLVPFLAPRMTTADELKRVIAADRDRGPALPPARIAKRLVVRDTHLGGNRAFRATRRDGASSPLKLFYLHGGAYVLDLLSVQWTIVDQLLHRVGGEAVVPIYPLAPEHGWREGHDAIDAAYADLVTDTDAKNVVIVADSAGGGLALALAQRLRDAGGNLPAAMILVSPWLDTSVGAAGQPEIEKDDPALTIEGLRRAGRLWARDLPLDDPRISPLFGDQHGLPPTIVFSGMRDILDSDAQRLGEVEPGHRPSSLCRDDPRLAGVALARGNPRARGSSRVCPSVCRSVTVHRISGHPVAGRDRSSYCGRKPNKRCLNCPVRTPSRRPPHSGMRPFERAPGAQRFSADRGR